MKNKKTKKIIAQLVEWFDDHFYKVIVLKKYFDAIPKNKLIGITTKENPDKTISIWIPSVTTKLGIAPKPFLNKWRGDVGNWEANRRMREGQDKGSNIHHAWQVVSNGGTVVYNPSRRPVFKESELAKMKRKAKDNFFVLTEQQEMFELWKLQEWFKIVQPRIILTEKIIHSLNTMDAGTVDGLYWINKGEYAVNGREILKLEAGYYVIDVKTGAMTDQNSDAQTACYAKILQEDNIDVIGTIILHTNSKVKTGIAGLSTKHRDKNEIEQDYKYYRTMSAAWAISDLATEKPEVFDFPSKIELVFKKEKSGKKKSTQAKLF